MNNRSLIAKVEVWLCILVVNSGCCNSSRAFSEPKPRAIITGSVSVTKIGARVAPDSSRIMLEKATRLYHEGQYAKAECILFQRLKQLPNRTNTSVKAIAINDLAIAQISTGKFLSAEKLFMMALSLKRPTDDKTRIDYGKIQNGLATLYKRQSRYTESEQLYRKAITSSISEEDVATFKNNLGSLFKLEGKYSEAEQLFRESFDLKVKLNAESSVVGQSMNNLASVLVMQKSYDEADELYKKAIKIEQAKNHLTPNLAIYLNNYGELKALQHKVHDAETFYRESIKIDEKVFGKVNVESATANSNLAELWSQQHKTQLAETLMERARFLDAKNPNITESDRATLMFNEAQNKISRGRIREGEALLLQSLQTNFSEFGIDHPNSCTIKKELGRFYEKFGPKETVQEELMKLRNCALNCGRI